jgi:hypothetical protein
MLKFAFTIVPGKTNETINGINELLEKDKRNTEILVSKNHKLIKAYYESEHLEIGILKHLIFNLASLSN